MTEKEAVKLMLMKKKMSQMELAQALGLSTQGAIGKTLSGKNDIRTGTLHRILEVLGCELVIRDKEDGMEMKIDIGGEEG